MFVFLFVGVNHISLVFSTGLTSSLEAKVWVDETPFEVSGDMFFALGGGARKGRERAAVRAPPLFHGLQFYFHGQHEKPPQADLSQLVKEGGGTVVTRKPAASSQKKADLVVLFDPSTFLDPNGLASLRKIATVKESSWVLSCISNYER